MKKEMGITLVSLVVTIILLLILAGVTLALISGSEGILGRTTKAVEKHKIAEIKEKVELKVAEDVERFHEEKYVDFSIDNAMSAYEYLKEKTEKTIQNGNEKYTITYTDSNTSDDNGIQVDYIKNRTQIAIKGTISQSGVINWDEEGMSGGSNSGNGENIGDTGDLEDGKIILTEKELEDKIQEAIKEKEEELAKLKTELDKTDATENQILLGKKAYSKGSLLTGTMANFVGRTENATNIAQDGKNALITMPKAGYYEESSKISVPMREITDIASICSNSTLVAQQSGQSGGKQNVNLSTVSYITDSTISAYNFLVMVVSVSGASNVSWYGLDHFSVSGMSYLELGGHDFSTYPSGAINNAHNEGYYRAILIPKPVEGITVSVNYQGSYGMSVWGIN